MWYRYDGDFPAADKAFRCIIALIGEVTMELTKRLTKLKKRLFEVEFHDKGVWHFLDTNLVEGNEEMAKEPLVVRKAMAQYHMGAHLPAVIKPD